MSIHRRIRERRLQLGLTSHGALAELLGVSWQTVQHWEKEDGTAPKRGRIDQVAEALQVSTAWLLNGEGDSAPKSDDQSRHIPPPKVSPPTHTQWVTDDEDRLLTLFRTTDDDGRLAVMRYAEGMRRVVKPAVVGNKV
jgi:transcriptional regulator with XRE-family HTH domain